MKKEKQKTSGRQNYLCSVKSGFRQEQPHFDKYQQKNLFIQKTFMIPNRRRG